MGVVGAARGDVVVDVEVDVDDFDIQGLAREWPAALRRRSDAKSCGFRPLAVSSERLLWHSGLALGGMACGAWLLRMRRGRGHAAAGGGRRPSGERHGRCGCVQRRQGRRLQGGAAAYVRRGRGPGRAAAIRTATESRVATAASRRAASRTPDVANSASRLPRRVTLRVAASASRRPHRDIRVAKGLGTRA